MNLSNNHPVYPTYNLVSSDESNDSVVLVPQNEPSPNVIYSPKDTLKDLKDPKQVMCERLYRELIGKPPPPDIVVQMVPVNKNSPNEIVPNEVVNDFKLTDSINDLIFVNSSNDYLPVKPKKESSETDQQLLQPKDKPSAGVHPFEEIIKLYPKEALNSLNTSNISRLFEIYDDVIECALSCFCSQCRYYLWNEGQDDEGIESPKGSGRIPKYKLYSHIIAKRAAASYKILQLLKFKKAEKEEEKKLRLKEYQKYYGGVQPFYYERNVKRRKQ